MTCSEVNDRELVELYLTGQLSEEESTAFELHYFDCAACAELVQATGSVQAALRSQANEIRSASVAPDRKWIWWAAPLAAAAIIAFGLFQFLPNRGAIHAPVMVAKSADYASLARLSPPVYQPSILRSGQSDAAEHFRAAMEYYTRGDYAGAVPKLQEALKLDDKSPAPRFYLGACYLLTGDLVRAATELERAALTPSPFTEEAHMLLAKTRLKQNDAEAARRQLEMVAADKGEFAAEASALLEGVQRIQSGK